MGQAAINRRQFLVRGGAASVALGLFAQLPAAARAAASAAAGASSELTSGQIGVVAGLVDAICAANLAPAIAATELGLQTPETFATAVSACDAETRAAIGAVLDVVEQGTGRTPFGALGSAGQAAFVAGTFAELDLYTASAQDEAVLDALTGSTNALVAALHPSAMTGVTAPAQPAVGRPEPRPFGGSADARYVFTQTLLCALTLVSEPLSVDAPLAPAPALSASSAAALSRWLALRSVGSEPPPELVDDIASDLAAAMPEQVEQRVYPCVALGRALTVWLAAGRI